jgi:hypothetical protein
LNRVQTLGVFGRRKMTMKRFKKLAVVCAASVLIFVAAGQLAAQGGKMLTSDPLTGLPIPPSEDKFHTGNAPEVIDAHQMCKSKAEMNMYSLSGIKMNATVAWYESKLAGFKKDVSYDGAQEVLFYKPDQTIAVGIMSKKAPQGSDANVDSIVYMKFTPGLKEKEILGLNSHHLVCL